VRCESRGRMLTAALYVCLAAACALRAADKAGAPLYETRKAFVAAHLWAGARLTMKTVVLAAKDKERLAKEWALARVDDSVTYALARDSAGRILGAAVFVDRVLEPYDENHRLGVALDSAGHVAGVALIGEHGQYAGTLATKAFMGQFVKKRPAKGYAVGREINAVSAATESTGVVADLVNMVVAVYRGFVLEPRDKGDR
jgi:hypothetical protein